MAITSTSCGVLSRLADDACDVPGMLLVRDAKRRAIVGVQCEGCKIAFVRSIVVSAMAVMPLNVIGSRDRRNAYISINKERFSRNDLTATRYDTPRIPD
jgi:hypothetical protein